MGTRNSPYANLFVRKEKFTIILAFFYLIYFWKSFIDNILFILVGSHTQPYDSESRKLKTKLYRKPTDCMTLLTTTPLT